MSQLFLVKQKHTAQTSFSVTEIEISSSGSGIDFYPKRYSIKVLQKSLMELTVIITVIITASLTPLIKH